APMNTKDLHALVHDDFSSPLASANAIIHHLKEHPTKHPVYLGNIHAWIYDGDPGYRANIHTLVAHIAQATDHRLFFYFEEENASHAPHAVSAQHGEALRELAKSASLLMATYVNGQQSHSEVVETVARFEHHYHDKLGVPLRSMLIDVDLSHPPPSFYYGTRGYLSNFNHVIGWALTAAYKKGFGGFHTMGNGPNASFGTKQASDSTYAKLNADWDALVAA